MKLSQAQLRSLVESVVNESVGGMYAVVHVIDYEGAASMTLYPSLEEAQANLPEGETNSGDYKLVGPIQMGQEISFYD